MGSWTTDKCSVCNRSKDPRAFICNSCEKSSRRGRPKERLVIDALRVKPMTTTALIAKFGYKDRESSVRFLKGMKEDDLVRYCVSDDRWSLSISMKRVFDVIDRQPMRGGGNDGE